MEVVEIMQFVSAVLVVIVCLIVLGCAGWTVGSYVLEQSRLAAEKQWEALPLGNSQSLSNLH